MYGRFFNLSNELLCIADFEGNFLDVNNAFTHILGFSKEHLLSKKFIEFVHPDDMEYTLKELHKLSSGQETIQFENRYIDSTGNTIIFSWNSYPDAENGRIYAVARDVTEFRQSQNHFDQLRKVIRNNVIFARTDSHGVITEVNDKFCQISGYAANELIGHTHKVVNSGQHDKAFFTKLWQTISSGEVWTGVITNRKKSGELYYVDSIISAVKALDGTIESYVAIRFDITEAVGLKEKSDKILNILNETSAAAKVGGWELDVTTGVLSWTDETFKITGVTQKQGYTPVLPEGLQLFTDEHKPIIVTAVQECINGKPYALELLALTPEGDEKWIFTDGHPNFLNGEIISISGTIQDIHEKKLTELSLNTERQKSIQNAKFASLGELAASVAHEINNPLGIISGYTEILKFNAEEKNLNKLDSILKSCDRISYIVNNLKRFSRTDEEPEKCRINLIEVCQEACTLVEPKIKRSLISFSTEFIDSAFIHGNHIEIEQVVINLVNNAIDAVGRNKNSWIKLSVVEQSEEYALFVEDSGTGIRDAVKVKMFEPFYTTKGVNKGTGLGLSVVKGIVDDHGGSIYLDSDKVNTCFCITLPKQLKS